MSSTPNRLYQFGEFTVDVDQRILLRNGTPLSLPPKLFDTFIILVNNRGRIVAKEELMNQLWPDTFVEEANLAVNIQQLRKVLGDNARKPLFIETVARRGYRFIAHVEEVVGKSGLWNIEKAGAEDLLRPGNDGAEGEPLENETTASRIGDCHNHSQQSVSSFGHKMDSPVASDRGCCLGNEQWDLVLVGSSEGSRSANWWEVHGGGSSFQESHR